MIAVVCLSKLSSEENLIVRGSVLVKTSIADSIWMINIIFFVEQISDKLQSARDQNHQVDYIRLPITVPSNKL